MAHPFRILSCCLLLLGAGMLLHAAPKLPMPADLRMLPEDSLPLSSMVYIEGEDEYGRVMSRSIGVIVKDGFVAVNYHIVAGMTAVKAYLFGDPKAYVSDGYLSVDEAKDLLVISVPNLKGPAAILEGLSFPADGQEVSLVSNIGSRRLNTAQGTVTGQKEVGGIMMPQIVTSGEDDFTNGPVFYKGAVVGFVTAGYLDRRYYSYAIHASDLRRLLNRSFIIKAFNSLKDSIPMKGSHFQNQLMETLSSVLWLSISEAERLSANKPKMVVIDVTTKWAGWGKLMERNYTSKRIIRYLNEHYYAVRMDAEFSDTIQFNRLQYTRNPGSPYHTLAYSLLEGQMEFPSTVFMDEKLNVLMVVPGLMDAQKLEVVLHYFAEKAYMNTRVSFQEYETQFLERRDP